MMAVPAPVGGFRWLLTRRGNSETAPEEARICTAERWGMADTTLQKQPGRGPGRPFVKGRSGNPAGRPPGSRNRTTRAAEALLEGEATALMRKAIERAFAGDAAMLRLCLERLIPPRRERAVHLALPRIRKATNAEEAMAAITAAAASGAITPGAAAEFGRLAEIFLRVVAASDFDRRLRLLEENRPAPL
jgi:hypothetical protein